MEFGISPGAGAGPHAEVRLHVEAVEAAHRRQAKGGVVLAAAVLQVKGEPLEGEDAAAVHRRRLPVDGGVGVRRLSRRRRSGRVSYEVCRCE